MPTKEASTQQAIALLESISSRPDLEKRLSAASDWSSAKKVAADAGFDLSGLTESDAKALVLKQGAARGRELSAADMAAVAGGAATPTDVSSSASPPPPTGGAPGAAADPPGGGSTGGFNIRYW
ncbi:MAG: hypothetical protein JWL61_3306 [Gemmatimonadetes bacterium]|nr:hypothetical protein [Gemmatimonadota bacterium]